MNKISLLSTSIVSTIFLAAGSHQLHAQGCVAARGAGNVMMPHIAPCDLGPQMQTHGGGKSDGKSVPLNTFADPDRWRVNLGYRFFQSDRHFVGDVEQVQRDAEGSSVVNISQFFDVGLEYRFNDRFSVALTVPFSKHERSSAIRNANNKVVDRYSVNSGGIGDVRLSGFFWVLDPKTNPKGNMLVGLGVDMPTGEDDQTDTHYRRVPGTFDTIESFTRHVDQSVQPGDGGWGVVVDVYGYYRLNDRTNLYAQGNYTITPEEDNGVTTGRSNPYEAIMSIADTYMVRAGVDYVLSPEHGIVGSLGWRMEGVMVRDLIGGSDWFRRPGYAMSFEPSLSWAHKGWSASVAVPIAVYRNRQRSEADEKQTAATGTWQHGDAAFADWSLILNIGKTF